MIRLRWALPLLLLAGGAAALEAQEFLDRGAFVIVRGGTETGRVEYAVRSTTGQQGQGGLQTVATTRTPAREVQYVLETDNNLAPITYQAIESSGGHVTRRVSAQVAGGRFSARASTDAGDVARELPARPPFAILGDDDYTVFYFIPRPEAGATRTLNLVRTRDLRATTGTVTGGDNDTVTVAGRPVVARRFELRLADGEVRQFWMTPAGSLVRVAVPAAGLIATRTEAPAQ